MNNDLITYSNTGEVLEVTVYGTMARVRVKFDVRDGAFAGFWFATVKAFGEAFTSFKQLQEGDLVKIGGNMRCDKKTEEYPNPRDYVDGKFVEVLTSGGPQAEKEPNMFQDSTVTNADADVPF